MRNTDNRLFKAAFIFLLIETAVKSIGTSGESATYLLGQWLLSGLGRILVRWTLVNKLFPLSRVIRQSSGKSKFFDLKSNQNQ